MIKKRWRATVLGLVSATAMLSAMLAGASPASASTDGDQSAKAGSPPSFGNGTCAVVAGSEVCFEPYGDKIWVFDATLADGKAAAAYWQNYLKDSAGNWVAYRTGECINHLGAGHWGYCNYDFYEDTTHNPYDGYGSGVRLYPLTEPDAIDPDNYVWDRNDA